MRLYKPKVGCDASHQPVNENMDYCDEKLVDKLNLINGKLDDINGNLIEIKELNKELKKVHRDLKEGSKDTENANKLTLLVTGGSLFIALLSLTHSTIVSNPDMLIYTVIYGGFIGIVLIVFILLVSLKGLKRRS